MSAIGRELLLLNMDAAMAKFRWDLFRPSNQPVTQAVRADVAVTPTKKRGIIHNSFNFSGDNENATLPKRRAGVNNVTLIRFSFFWVFLSRMPLRASILKRAVTVTSVIS